MARPPDDSNSAHAVPNPDESTVGSQTIPNSPGCYPPPPPPPAQAQAAATVSGPRPSTSPSRNEPPTSQSRPRADSQIPPSGSTPDQPPPAPARSLPPPPPPPAGSADEASDPQDWDFTNRGQPAAPVLPGTEDDEEQPPKTRRKLLIGLALAAILLVVIAFAVPALFQGRAPADNPTEGVPPELFDEGDPADEGDEEAEEESGLDPTPSPPQPRATP